MGALVDLDEAKAARIAALEAAQSRPIRSPCLRRTCQHVPIERFQVSPGITEVTCTCCGLRWREVRP